MIFILIKIDKWTPKKRNNAALKKSNHKEGISIIIPERDSVALLEICIPTVIEALMKIDSDSKIIIVANGSNPDDYFNIKVIYPKIKWHFSKKSYGFSQAINIGLEMSCFSWVYLLNNDMRITRNSLSTIWQWRSESIFALASQIFFEDTTKRREETGYTGFKLNNGSQGLYDRTPNHTQWPAQHMYAGGGASLFQKEYLKLFIKESHAYSPFYWEDVEWGLRAQQLGLKVLFIPQSYVYHQHRATVSRFYSKDKLQTMFMKNGIQCSLRNKLAKITEDEINDLYYYKLLNPKNIIAIIKSRWHGARSLHKPHYFKDDVLSFYPKRNIDNTNKPWIIWVVPFAINPVSHGSARRVVSITNHLSQFFRIALLSDEGWAYDLDESDSLAHFSRIDLIIKPRPQDKTQDRAQRIQTHSRKEMRQQLELLIEDIKPKVVQVEHEELCYLIPKHKTCSWVLTLHDVNHNNEKIDDWINHRLRQFNNVICCSNEDALLLNDTKTKVIENGTEIFNSKEYHRSNGLNLLFIGPFRYKPNFDGICYFINHCFHKLKKSFPKLTLTILSGHGGLDIANKNPIFNHNGIELVGHTDNVKGYLHNATMTINPLLKIRGSSLKTLESIANGRICISTTAAARGFLDRNIPALKLADSPQQWHDIITHLLTDQAQRLGFESPENNNIDNFDWINIASKYRELYEET